MKQITTRKSFTLIELMLAMVLLSILAVLLIGNFNTTLKRGRDAQRKNDLSQLQKALELYYEDNLTYPLFDIISPNTSKKFCKSQSCLVLNEPIYMIKTPTDPSSPYIYRYIYENPVDGIASKYYLFSYIENDLDKGSGVNISGFGTVAGFTGSQTCDTADTANSCRYYVGSSNTPPLTPNP